MSQWILSGWYFNYIGLKTLHVHSTFGCCTLTFNTYFAWLCVWSEGSTLMMDVTAVLFFMKVSTDVEHILICAVFKGGFFQETDFNLISAERWYLTPPPAWRSRSPGNLSALSYWQKTKSQATTLWVLLLQESWTTSSVSGNSGLISAAEELTG